VAAIEDQSTHFSSNTKWTPKVIVTVASIPPGKEEYVTVIGEFTINGKVQKSQCKIAYGQTSCTLTNPSIKTEFKGGADEASFEIEYLVPSSSVEGGVYTADANKASQITLENPISPTFAPTVTPSISSMPTITANPTGLATSTPTVTPPTKVHVAAIEDQSTHFSSNTKWTPKVIVTVASIPPGKEEYVTVIGEFTINGKVQKSQCKIAYGQTSCTLTNPSIKTEFKGGADEASFEIEYLVPSSSVEGGVYTADANKASQITLENPISPTFAPTVTPSISSMPTITSHPTGLPTSTPTLQPTLACKQCEPAAKCFKIGCNYRKKSVDADGYRYWTGPAVQCNEGAEQCDPCFPDSKCSYTP